LFDCIFYIIFLNSLQEYSDIAWAKNPRKIWKIHAYA